MYWNYPPGLKFCWNSHALPYSSYEPVNYRQCIWGGGGAKLFIHSLWEMDRIQWCCDGLDYGLCELWTSGILCCNCVIFAVCV